MLKYYHYNLNTSNSLNCGMFKVNIALVGFSLLLSGHIGVCVCTGGGGCWRLARKVHIVHRNPTQQVTMMHLDVIRRSFCFTWMPCGVCVFADFWQR